ncbi:4346_t:CDS:2 [Cetraspora pellucida]|uniref:4346_t:CDS:1 n=1 Tax=Cetraspora pellucida TaxID=1433469 RepID=A0A9N9EVH9_9GLOM|nr:4346_t:CDS:2 [Cetraspora pellucida]
MASTNTYNLPLSIFAMVNNNFKSRIVAQVVLPDETSESYKWLLEQTIDATGVHPGVFIINADPGLESIVPEIYPNTYLVHCIWHIGCNIEKQLSKALEVKLFAAIDKMMNTLVINEQFIREKSQEHSNSTSNLLNIPSFSTKQLTKETLLGLVHKCVELVDYDDSNDFDSLMKMFKKWIYKHEEIQCNKVINMSPNTRHDEVSEYEQVTENDQNLEQELVMKEDQFIERNQILENTQVYETIYLDVQNLLRHIRKG